MKTLITVTIFILIFPPFVLSKSIYITPLEEKSKPINTSIEDEKTADTTAILLSDNSDQLKRIEKDLMFLREKTGDKDWFSHLLNFIGVVLGVLIGGFLSLKLHYHQRKFAISQSLIDWKVKQLAELYGPLHALLHQSNALYRHMNKVLSEKDPQTFRLHDDQSKNDFDKKVFQIYQDSSWVDFRTVTHINEVYGQKYGIEKYFDTIIEIGERIVEIVEQKAGYLRDDQVDLADVFGRYLAHYAVLREIHCDTKYEVSGEHSGKIMLELPVDDSAAFPREIQRLVKTGYQSLNKELNEWAKKGEIINGESIL